MGGGGGGGGGGRGAKRKLRLKLNVLGSETNCSSHFPLAHPMYVVGHNNYRPRTSLSPTVDLTHNSLADTPAITDQMLDTAGRFYVAFPFPTACLQPIHAQVSHVRYAAAARTDTPFPTRASSDTDIHALHRPGFNTLPVRFCSSPSYTQFNVPKRARTYTVFPIHA